MPLESLKELMVLIFGKSNDSLKELTFLIFNKSRIECKAIHDPQCFKPLKNIESFLAQILAEFRSSERIAQLFEDARLQQENGRASHEAAVLATDGPTN